VRESSVPIALNISVESSFKMIVINIIEMFIFSITQFSFLSPRKYCLGFKDIIYLKKITLQIWPISNTLRKEGN